MNYLLFAYDAYDAAGGWRDYIGSYSSIDEALIGLQDTGENYDFFHIVDLSTKIQVWDHDGKVYGEAGSNDN